MISAAAGVKEMGGIEHRRNRESLESATTRPTSAADD